MRRKKNSHAEKKIFPCGEEKILVRMKKNSHAVGNFRLRLGEISPGTVVIFGHSPALFAVAGLIPRRKPVCARRLIENSV
jgi:hypothetical protein